MKKDYFIIAVFIAFILVLMKGLQFLNVLPDKEDKKEKKFFNFEFLSPNYWKSKLKGLTGNIATDTVILAQFAAKYNLNYDNISKIGKNIFDSKGLLIDDEQKAVDNLLKLENAVQVSRLADIFEKETGKNFANFLNSFMEQRYISKVYDKWKKF